jgi:hypothetical protein
VVVVVVVVVSMARQQDLELLSWLTRQLLCPAWLHQWE